MDLAGLTGVSEVLGAAAVAKGSYKVRSSRSTTARRRSSIDDGSLKASH